MAKVIKTKVYRGVKVRTDDKVVIHFTDMDNQKIHLHMKWNQLLELLVDLGRHKKEEE